MPPILFWVGAEAPVTLLCICLPAMLPLFRQLASKISPRFKPYSVASEYAGQGQSLRSRSGNFRATMSSNAQGVQMRSMKSSTDDREDDSLQSESSWRGILPGQETSARALGPEPGAPRVDVPERSIRVERNITIDRQG